MILNAAYIESALVNLLKRAMRTLNEDETNRLFDFEVQIGSFSNRIRMAQSFRIITRASGRRLEIIKQIRNTAAHAHSKLIFDNIEIQNAVVQLIDHKD